jgi:hypothetical protein
MSRAKSGEYFATPSATAKTLGMDFQTVKVLFWQQVLQEEIIADYWLMGSPKTNILIQQCLESGWRPGIKIPESFAKQLKKINKADWTYLKLSMRHFANNVTKPKATGNTMFLISKEEARVDLNEIHEKGDAIRNGDKFTTSSGRIFGIHDGSVHPIEGQGLVDITSKEYNILVTAKKRSVSDAMKELNYLSEKKMLTSEQISRTILLLELIQK